VGHFCSAKFPLRTCGPEFISGGQPGADRAALDFAIEHGILYGGRCPKGRLAEDGPIARHYCLQETPNRSYPQRTEWNMRDSDGTSNLFHRTGAHRRVQEIREICQRKHGRPVHHVSRAGGNTTAEAALRRFIKEHGIKVLNVAGPRASKEPEVYGFVKAVLDKVLDV